MRIIAGSARGRRFKGPRGPGLRPTADQVREALFNILGSRVWAARVLDLFAGTGALSFEALSRGAAHAVLVDNGRESLTLCHENAALLGFSDQIELLNLRVDNRVSQRLLSKGPFGLVFADPPYAQLSFEHLLAWLDPALFVDSGILVIEHDRRTHGPKAGESFERFDERRFGDTALSFYRYGTPSNILTSDPDHRNQPQSSAE